MQKISKTTLLIMGAIMLVIGLTVGVAGGYFITSQQAADEQKTDTSVVLEGSLETGYPSATFLVNIMNTNEQIGV
ncbi:hypothetical protein KC640_01580, partial [Candidatus Dojkabacteria bacterium]|nr:hypothetical protein [Candidatus Dojkabacteria bacterium]